MVSQALSCAAIAAFVTLAACDDRSPPEPKPVSPTALRILPLGDSITEGGAGTATYRYWLQKDLERKGVEFDFVGSQRGVHGGQPRFEDFDLDHEGHWGWTSGEVLDRIAGWAASANPDVVLIHLGTNDLAARAREIPGNLAAIIALLRERNPSVAIFLARLIPPAGFPTAHLKLVNTAIEALAGELSTAESPVILVAQDAGFRPGTDTLDGVHPNESGEKKMAAKWLEALDAWRLARGR